MYEYHTTAQNVRMLICSMEDGHLMNTIKLYCSKIQVCVESLQTQETTGSLIVQAFHPELDVRQNKERALNLIKLLTNKLAPYIMEASLRDLDMVEHLRMAYGRKSKINAYSSVELPSLLPYDESEVHTTYRDIGDFQD